MIGTVEDALLDRIRTVLGSRVRTVEALAGQISEDMLKRILAAAPAVYLLFTGGQVLSSLDATPRIDGRWIVYIVTAHANGARARRHGDSRQAGAYELAESLVGQLHGWTVPDVGTIAMVRLDLLFQDALEERGVALYGLVLALPMPFEQGVNATELEGFEVFHADYDLQPTDDGVDAEDDVTLEQDS